MEYFVSAENTPYYHWQLELLIESFKVNKCEDKLLVALAESSDSTNPNFCRNVFNHKRIKGYENIGETRGYKPLNNLYSLAKFYSELKNPFVVMPTDVVLKNPLNINFSNLPEITFTPNLFLTMSLATEFVGPFWEWFNKPKNQYQTHWIPLGPIMVFNNIPLSVVERTITITEKLAVEQLVTGKTIWEHTDKLAWIINMIDYIGKIKMQGDYTLTTNMLEDGNSSFIHYEHGLPPVFNKTMFQYLPPNYISFGDPFEILAQNSPTPNSHFMSNLAKVNLTSRPKN